MHIRLITSATQAQREAFERLWGLRPPQRKPAIKKKRPARSDAHSRARS